MKITDCTKHKKYYATHQLMMSKLCTYENAYTLMWNIRNLQKLKEKLEDTNYFYGRFRIPKFSFETRGLQLYLKMEYMFGKQVYKELVTKELRDMVWEDMVNTDDTYAFKDLNLDNFIRRGTKPLAEGDPYWEYAYVDLEAYSTSDKPKRVDKFKTNPQWQL